MEIGIGLSSKNVHLLNSGKGIVYLLTCLEPQITEESLTRTNEMKNHYLPKRRLEEK